MATQLHTGWLAATGALLALLATSPVHAADHGLTLLAVPPASGGKAQVLLEVRDPALQQELRASGAAPARFRTTVDSAGAQVTAVRRLVDSGERRYTVLAFDQSRSFAPYWPRAFELARAYVSALGPSPQSHTVAVMLFGVKKVLLCEEGSAQALSACLAKAEQSGAQQQATRLKFYIREAAQDAARAQPLPTGSREVIVFTDAGEESDALTVQQVASEARERGVRVHTVVFSGQGRGKGIARRLDDMAQLASGSGGRYVQVEDGDAPQALTGLATALEHLYWLELSFCGVKPGQATDRLSVEALSGGTRVAWSDPLTFRQSAEGSSTQPCPTAATPPPAQADAPAQPQPSPSQPESSLPWLWIAVGLLALLALVLALVALARRRAPPPAPAPVLVQPAPAVAPPPPAPAPAPVAEPPPPAPAPAPEWKDPFATLPETRLVILKAPESLKLEPFYRVHKSSFTLGAGTSEVDLAVNIPQVSSRHATVQLFKAGNLFLKDEGSTNGTYVEGRRLAPGERVQVRPGQVLRLSQHFEFTLEQPGRQVAAAPAAGSPVVTPPPSPAAPPPAEPQAPAPRVREKTIYAPARGDDE